MSPYLTGQGKWLFVTGVLFVLLGAMVREPLLILFGQIPFAVLMMSLVTLLPAARSMDRRTSRFVVDSEDDRPGVIRLRRSAQKTLALWMENRSATAFRICSLSPFTTGEVDVEPGTGELHIDSGGAGGFEITIRPKAVGRSSLQGFDVVLSDRLGLVAARDYLPCVQVFETYPVMSSARRRLSPIQRPSSARAIRVVDHRNRAGTDLRELRDYEPGDPLRTIAWKATVRQRRLISREFDDERTQAEYVALDISSSMRAGTPRGEKFEHAVALTARLCDGFLGEGRQVGLWTFDGSIYGDVDAQRGSEQRRRIQRHLVGLHSVVGSGRTSLDDEDLEAVAADYLLVQERLDFRRGRGLHGEVDSRLLQRWLRSTITGEERCWQSPGESYGVLNDNPGLIRRFFRLRGMPLQPPSEVPSGAKIAGLEAVIEAMVRRAMTGGRLTIISDLCGLSDVEILERTISVARRRGTEIRVLAPFTPHYGEPGQAESSRAALVRDLFTRAERDDRLDVARRLESMGIAVRFVGPQ